MNIVEWEKSDDNDDDERDVMIVNGMSKILQSFLLRLNGSLICYKN